MPEKDSELYRSKALERLSSPEALDQLMVVVRPRDWLPLVTVALVILAIIVWSVRATIPTNVSARGVLVYPSRLVECESATTGLLKDLPVKAGDQVTAGTIIATIDQSQISKQLAEDRAILAALRTQDSLQKDLQEQQVRTELEHIEAERKSIQAQEETIEKTLQSEQGMAEYLKSRVEGLRKLQAEGLLAEVSPELFVAQQGVRENITRVSEAHAKREQLKSQLKQLDSRQAALRRDRVDSATLRGNSIRDLTARIAVNEHQLAKNSEIRCGQSGRVVEVTAQAGGVVAAGDRIATIETDQPGKLVSVSYFTVADGKKIRVGMPVEIVPDVAERQRFGGIVGTVESVSELPVTREAAKLIVGSSELLDAVLPAGAHLQVITSIQPDATTASGYKWTASSGPEIPITAGMTSTTLAITESRAPITYVFPFLRSLSSRE